MTGERCRHCLKTHPGPMKQIQYMHLLNHSSKMLAKRYCMICQLEWTGTTSIQPPVVFESPTPSPEQQSHQDPACLLLGRAVQPHPHRVWCKHRWEVEGKMRHICFATHSASGVLANLLAHMAEFGLSMVKPLQLLDKCCNNTGSGNQCQKRQEMGKALSRTLL